MLLWQGQWHLYLFISWRLFWDSLVSPLVFPSRIPIKLAIWKKSWLQDTFSLLLLFAVLFLHNACTMEAQLNCGCIDRLHHHLRYAAVSWFTAEMSRVLDLWCFPCIVCYRQVSRRAYHFQLQCWTYVYEQWDNVNLLLTKQWTCDVFKWHTQLCFWKWQ